MDRGRAGDEGRPVESGKARVSGSGPDAVEVHRAGATMTTNGPGCGASDPRFPPVGASPKATP